VTDPILPAPLVPADVDLRDFPGMWLDTDRVLKSETWRLGTSDEKAAAITLWMESWHEVPSGSLPNNDRLLSKLSQAERWTKSKTHALRGWVECSDGRLYHPIVAEKALEAWIEKLAAAISGATGNAKRWQVEVDTTTLRAQFKTAVETLRQLKPASRALKKKVVAVILAGSRPESGGESGPQSGGESGGDRKGQRPDQTRPDQNGLEDSVPTGTGGKPPPDAKPAKPTKAQTPAEQEKAELWHDLKALLVAQETAATTKAAGVLAGGLASKYGQDVFLEATRATLAANPADAHTYLIALCETAAGKRQSLGKQGMSEAERQALNARTTAEAAALLGFPAQGEIIDATV
jgi:hypothetical protein